MTVFISGLGFRSSDGVTLAEPVTVTRENDQGLRVMHLASTDRGTEVAFEVRDASREGTCQIGPVDHTWSRELQVELRDESGAAVPRAQRGMSYGMGQHAYGFYRVELTFDRLPPATRSATLQLRGPLGEWDVPLTLAPIAELPVPVAKPVGVEQERRGITVRVVSMVTTARETVIEVEATALPPVRSILGIGAEMIRNGEDVFVLRDDRGHRLEEIPSRDLWHGERGDSGRTVAMFPAIAADARVLTLFVPGVVIDESDAELELELPLDDAVERHFGGYPVRVGPARVTDQLRAAPGEPPRHGIEVGYTPAGWYDGGRAVKPRRVAVDGADIRCGFGWRRGADAEALTLNVPLADGASAQTVTLRDPLVKVRGPWEIAFRIPA